jgi:hypothetical protein
MCYSRPGSELICVALVAQALLTSRDAVGAELMTDQPLWAEVAKHFTDVEDLARLRGVSRNLRNAIDDPGAETRQIQLLGRVFGVAGCRNRAAYREDIRQECGDTDAEPGRGHVDDDDDDEEMDAAAEQRSQAAAAERDRVRRNALKRVSELQKDAEKSVAELRELDGVLATAQKLATKRERELKFLKAELKHAERRGGGARHEEGQWSFFEETGGVGKPPVKDKYRDTIVKLIVRRNTPLVEAIPSLLDVLSGESHIKAAVDDYVTKQQGHGNTHHSARRCVVEIERFLIEDLAFRLAERVGFTARSVSRDEPEAAHPLSAHMPEAWARGVVEVVDEDTRNRIDPDGKLKAQADEYKTDVFEKIGSLPPVEEEDDVLGEDSDDDGLDDVGGAAPPLLDVAAIAIELGSLQDHSSTCSVGAVDWDAPTAGNEADSIGDLLLIKEDDGELWLNQIVTVVQLRQEDGDDDDSDDDACTVTPMYTLQVVDPRVIAEEEVKVMAQPSEKRAEMRQEQEADRLWSPEGGDLRPRHGEHKPLLLGKVALSVALDGEEEDDDCADLRGDTESGSNSEDESESDGPISFENPLQPAPAMGVDATSFYDNSTFLCAWIFMQGDRSPGHRNDMFGWAWRMAAGHGPAADVIHIFAFFEGMRAVQSRMGVPVAQQSFADDIEWFPVDNENSNTGTITALPVRLNYACRLEHDWLVRHGYRTGKFREKKIIGCGLHVLNLCDKRGSEMWREMDMGSSGDPYHADCKPIIGGRDTKESWIHFVCRFFSRTMRWNVDWRSWLSTEHNDTAMCARALLSRFWSKLKVGEFLFDRLDWLWEWFSGTREEMHRKKKSAVFYLLSEMKQHKQLLADDLLVMRIEQLWLHGPIGHSVSKDSATAAQHVVRLRELVKQAEVMAGEDEAAADERTAVFQKCAAEAYAQRYELQQRSTKPWNDDLDAGDSRSEKARKKAFIKTQKELHDETVADFMPGGSKLDASVEKPSDHQHERLRLYAKATAEKHRAFLSNLLAEDGETGDIIATLPDMLHTFHVRFAAAA